MYQSKIPHIIMNLNIKKSLLFEIFLFKRKIAWGRGEGFKDWAEAAKTIYCINHSILQMYVSI